MDKPKPKPRWRPQVNLDRRFTNYRSEVRSSHEDGRGSIVEVIVHSNEVDLTQNLAFQKLITEAARLLDEQIGAARNMDKEKT